MLHDGLHLRFQEGTALGIVVHGLQFLQQHGTTVYPTVEGFHRGVRCAQWLVKQSQFGLAVSTWCEHVFLIVFEYSDSVKIRNIYQFTKYFPFYFTVSQTFKDIYGHLRTFTDIAPVGCIIFA